MARVAASARSAMTPPRTARLPEREEAWHPFVRLEEGRGRRDRRESHRTPPRPGHSQIWPSRPPRRVEEVEGAVERGAACHPDYNPATQTHGEGRQGHREIRCVSPGSGRGHPDEWRREAGPLGEQPARPDPEHQESPGEWRRGHQESRRVPLEPEHGEIRSCQPPRRVDEGGGAAG